MMAGPTHYCWSCYAAVAAAAGLCPHCGGRMEAPPGTGYADRLLWALDHPLVERRMVAIQVLAARREVRAVDRLTRLARSHRDPYLAAAAVAAVVSIAGEQASADLLAELAEHAPAPVRRTVRKLRGHHEDGKEVGG